MKARATTRVDVYRDADASDRDGYGDETETGAAPIATGVLASIIEESQRRADPTSGDLVNVSALVGRVGALADVQRGDRLKDTLGNWYAVEAVHAPASPTATLDRRLELTQV